MMVRERGVEPLSLSGLDPKSSAYASSATLARLLTRIKAIDTILNFFEDYQTYLGITIKNSCPAIQEQERSWPLFLYQNSDWISMLIARFV